MKSPHLGLGVSEEEVLWIPSVGPHGYFDDVAVFRV
jgi:hypothetical protein